MRAHQVAFRIRLLLIPVARRSVSLDFFQEKEYSHVLQLLLLVDP